MQDLIYEYYGIYPYFDDGFHFVDHHLEYILYPCSDMVFLAKLLEASYMVERQLHVSGFKAVQNKHGDYISNGYVLFMYQKKQVGLLDVFYMNQIPFDDSPIDLLEIRDKWVNKVDFITRRYLQLLDLNHPCYEQYCIMTVFYLGLAETAIAYLVDVIYDHPNTVMLGYITHQRLRTICFEEIYNPLFFTKDSRGRDIIELYKCNIVHLDAVHSFITTHGLLNIEIHYMMARALFPTYYFDYIEEDYFKESTSHKEVLEAYHKIQLHLLRIKELYYVLNALYPLRPINWIMND